MHRMIFLLAASGMTLTFTSCRSQESFLTVQTCLVNQKSVVELTKVMRAIAKAEGLKFIENSAQTGGNLKAVGADELLKRDASLAIDLHIEGERGMGVTASNLGLPPFQVALGFTEGSDAARARQLSDRLIRALSQRWHVEKVPKGKGVRPMKNCEL